MIRNVVIHASSEQPLMADLFDLPSAEDTGLLCTNVRMMDGKRPVFIDHIDSTFFFPYHVIRFIEIPKGAVPAGAHGRRRGPAVADDALAEVGEPEAESLLPVALGPPSATNGDGELDIDIEIDEDFLQKVRDI
jgi:hypothetical protein